jgi:hypothetical protein
MMALIALGFVLMAFYSLLAAHSFRRFSKSLKSASNALGVAYENMIDLQEENQRLRAENRIYGSKSNNYRNWN